MDKLTEQQLKPKVAPRAISTEKEALKGLEITKKAAKKVPVEFSAKIESKYQDFLED